MLKAQTRTTTNKGHVCSQSLLNLPRLHAVVLLSIGALGMAIGCSDGRPERVEVSGKVLIDGKPLSLGNVKFVPTGARPSAGKIDESGNFTLSCYDGQDGVVPGTHRVQVSASKVLNANEIHWYAPKQYASFRTSGISLDIDEPKDDVVIELTWGKKKPKNGEYLLDKSK